MLCAVGVPVEVELDPCEPGCGLEVAGELIVRERVDESRCLGTIGLGAVGRPADRIREGQLGEGSRAESRISEARGVTADWLLGLANAPQGRQEVTPSVQIESAESPGGGSPIDQWRREAAGMKLRYVPSNLPDMLGLGDEEAEPPPPDSPALAGQPEKVLGGFRLGEMDVEIAMPVQTLRDLSELVRLAS